MRARRWLLAALVAVAGCAGRQGAGAAGREHPSVDVGLSTCSSCHAEVTPKVAAQWRDGRHGLALVECVVCHGSTGADFRARPGTAACRGCHPAQVEAASRTAPVRDTTPGCFACHSPHSLQAQGAVSAHQTLTTGSSR